MVGWDKGGRGITQHDDPGSHKDCTRPSVLENDPEPAAIACLSSIATDNEVNGRRPNQLNDIT